MSRAACSVAAHARRLSLGRSLASMGRGQMSRSRSGTALIKAIDAGSHDAEGHQDTNGQESRGAASGL